jgi:shikimate kinase
MGSGKTTIGKCLASEMNLQFVDLDLFMENYYRKKIGEIFKEKGEEGFRLSEKKALREVSSFENVLISTGGGTPCFFDNMETMNKEGLTVYLKTSPERLAGRLNQNKSNRPLIRNKNTEELISFISENLKEREVFYNQAQVIFDLEKSDPTCINQTVDDLMICLTPYCKS